MISDLIRTNRVLIEDNLEHTKQLRFGRSVPEVTQGSGSPSRQELFPVEAGQH